QVPIPDDLREEEHAARFQMLEQLADHDDYLLEQPLNDEEPDLATVCGELRRETAEGLVVPVMLGSARNGYGVSRLLNGLSHDTPAPATTAERLGIDGPVFEVFKVANDTSVGRLALGRVFDSTLAEGTDLKTAEGVTQRVGAIFGIQGSTTMRFRQADP